MALVTAFCLLLPDLQPGRTADFGPVSALAQNGRPIVQPGDSRNSNFHPLSPLLRLFGVENSRRRTRIQEREPRQRLQPSREPARPVVVEVPKEADARVVLVVGDALAGELAEGLEATYSEVRRCASTACRSTMQALQGQGPKPSATGSAASSRGAALRPSWC